MSRQHEFLQGLRDMLPMLLGAMPFGIIYGSLAGAAGLSAWQAVGMSVLVFAGSAQFIAISLLGGGATLAVLWLTTLVVNLRHALYSATLQPFVRHLSKRWRVPLAFWLTDETFAVVQQRYAETDASPHKHWYFLGAGLAMYVNWVSCTLIGLVFGQAVPNIAAWGLDFAMIATFIGVVVPMLRNRPQVAAALVAAVVALVCHELPYKLGLMAAAFAGILVGVLLERYQRPLQEEPC
ncbi:branched-chain amino acid ABC transporter permease [Pseudomonas daroniae]|uniref:Branched-chain amino acid ABC transporter permease n=1 Tax=Phytopseudomonas daroniae TaxID=2487519 RepID=A0A4Q9QRH3_9GAMM|nr:MULTISPECIES: AzlC family ABC transporter permease [Pseudomonas]TBU83439.1 branched-chain amino acid ABC transporter permease [Pseudomonas daroniae]TBU85078.1 branched-chain amino acid ABC transporter permease [Pseudomonas sp. FRB 228]TBU93629.1 branched-chain amino acid ABC transporter permease [Pseudomonas daroniae]